MAVARSVAATTLGAFSWPLGTDVRNLISKRPPSALSDSSDRFALASMSGRGRQDRNVAGIGEAASTAAIRHIAAVRDSDFRLLSGPVVGPWLKLTLAR